MSFRKRNVVVSTTGSAESRTTSAERVAPPGVRSSPLDGRATTSTGTRSLDALLAGHAGLAMGSSVVIEESGTTDFGGALLRYYAAEGVTQGHRVHVLGMDEAWGRELPGLGGSVEGGHRSRDNGGPQTSGDKMRIAWRYERLGEFGAGVGARGGRSSTVHTHRNIICASRATMLLT